MTPLEWFLAGPWIALAPLFIIMGWRKRERSMRIRATLLRAIDDLEPDRKQELRHKVRWYEEGYQDVRP